MTVRGGHNDDRRLVPRWRPFHETVRLGDLDPLRRAVNATTDDEIVRARTRANAHRSTFATAELVSTLLAHGKREAAREATRELGETPATLALVKSRLSAEGPPPSSGIDDSDFDASSFARALGADARRRVKVHNRNPAAWVDLALAHTVQGFTDLATREMRRALQLAPDSRFVLRSAARLFVHMEDPEQANSVLNQSPRVAEDPWLMAAEISTYELAFNRTRNARAARTLIEFAAFSPRALSELRSELATAEMRSGHDRKARELFHQSFSDPTENAVAQAVSWAERSSLILDPSLLDGDRVYEARALDSARAGNWASATDEASAWHRDQPFSVEPFQFASYTAALGSGDYERALQIAASGLEIHRSDRTLRNNAAYALANLGRTIEARTQLVEPTERSSVEDLTEWATMGLICYREGRPSDGEFYYQTAVAGFTRLKRDDLAAIATIHWDIEQTRSGRKPLDQLVKRLQRVFPRVPPAERDALAQRAIQILETMRPA